MVPLIGMTQAGSGKFFTDEGLPTGGPGWDEIDFPDFGQEKVFALEVTGDSMAPLYRDGDMLIVSPTASTRKGDRVVVRTTTGEVLAKELKRRSAKNLELISLNQEHEDRMIPSEEVAWVARIMWARASQTLASSGRASGRRSFRNASCSRTSSPASAFAISARVSVTP